MADPWDQLLGPNGLAVAAIIAVGVLWRSHAKGDQERREDLLSANSRIDKLGDSIDANTSVMERAVEFNERLTDDLASARARGTPHDPQ